MNIKSKKEIKTFRPTRWWSNVQALRADARLSEIELSKYIGKYDGYITNAIKNSGIPNVSDALMLAEAFNTTVEEIAFGVIGLEIRKAQLEAELLRISDEIEDAKKDSEKISEVRQNEQRKHV